MSETQTLKKHLRDVRQPLPPLQNVEEAAAAIRDLLQQNASVTYSLYYGNQTDQRLYSFCQYPELSRVTTGKNVRTEIVAAYIQNYLGFFYDSACCVGAWYNSDENMTYLEVAVVFNTKHQAATYSRIYQCNAFDVRHSAVISQEELESNS